MRLWLETPGKLIYLIALMMGVSASAQQDSWPGTHIRFDKITLEDGLSQSNVQCIFQDSTGFMWFGTRDGLNRYDGYKFTVYRHDPEKPNSIGSNVITALYEDQSGYLWVGTDGGGLNRFDKAKDEFTRFRHDPEREDSLSSDTVLAIHQTRDGRIWVGAGDGLNYFNPETNLFKRHPNEESERFGPRSSTIWSIHEDESGYLWIATNGGGLIRFNPNSGDTKRFINSLEDPKSLSHNSVYTITADRDDSLWLGTLGGGLNRFDKKKGVFEHFKHDPNDPGSLAHNVVYAAFRDQGGDLWVGTFGGLCKYNRKTQAFNTFRYDPLNSDSLSHEFVYSIFEDRAGVLWFGTHGGLNKFDRMGEQFLHYKHDPTKLGSLSHHWVRAIYEDRAGTLWVGTNEGGLNRFDADSGRFIHYRHNPDDATSLSNDQVSCIYESSGNQLWIGTSHGLNRMNRFTGGFTRFIHDQENPSSISNDRIRTIHEDRSGVLWVGTQDGLNLFDPRTQTFAAYKNDPNRAGSLSDSRIRAVYEDRAGVLWVGTDRGGINRFHRDEDRFQHFLHDPENAGSLSRNRVISIHEDINGLFWIGTDGGGLNKMDRDNETFTHYRTSDGLPNDVVYGIQSDPLGFIWLSTNMGLSRFNPTRETFTNYDIYDGLQGNEFNLGADFLGRTGALYFGGINGFNVFFPGKVRKDPYIPNVVITGFSVFNKSVNLDPQDQRRFLDKTIYEAEEVTLTHRDYVFSFEFAALHYAKPEKNRYAYKLEGFDENWIYTDAGKRFATYTKLDPGTYTFRVKGSNKDGVWNEAGAKIKVNIIPPFWRTWWFRVLEILFALAIVAGLFVMQRNRLKNQKREALQALELERKTAELDFAREIQLSMLPKTELDLGMVEVVGRMRTASEVGGDYFDFIPLEQDRYLLVWGDATGHGMSAGLIVGMTKATIMSLVNNLGALPAEVLIRKINTTLREAIAQKSIGMCLGLGVLDVKQLGIEICSAGMPFPYHYCRGANHLTAIKLKCPPLAYLKELPQKTEYLQLSPGDVLVFVSDGLMERSDPEGRFWGERALRNAVEHICQKHHEARDIAEALFKANDAFAAGKEQEDDITIVVARVK